MSDEPEQIGSERYNYCSLSAKNSLRGMLTALSLQWGGDLVWSRDWRFGGNVWRGGMLSSIWWRSNTICIVCNQWWLILQELDIDVHEEAAQDLPRADDGSEDDGGDSLMPCISSQFP